MIVVVCLFLSFFLVSRELFSVMFRFVFRAIIFMLKVRVFSSGFRLVRRRGIRYRYSQDASRSEGSGGNTIPRSLLIGKKGEKIVKNGRGTKK